MTVHNDVYRWSQLTAWLLLITVLCCVAAQWILINHISSQTKKVVNENPQTISYEVNHEAQHTIFELLRIIWDRLIKILPYDVKVIEMVGDNGHVKIIFESNNRSALSLLYQLLITQKTVGWKLKRQSVERGFYRAYYSVRMADVPIDC